MPESTDVLEAQEQQRKGAKKATIEAFKSKKRAVDEFELQLGDDWYRIEFRSVGGKRYSKMIDECPPDIAGQARGDTYDEDKFAPLLLSETCVEPKFTLSEWETLWADDDWSRGERMALFGRAVQLALRGLDTRPTSGV